MAKIDLICVGKIKANSPEHALYHKYISRCRFDIRLVEIAESKSKTPALARAEEAAGITAKLAHRAFQIYLDERGRDLSSPDLAAVLQGAFDRGQRPTFLIGSSYGFDPVLADQADLHVRFGRLVWPHLLIRAMLAEQIYRAQTILDGHPYHRA